MFHTKRLAHFYTQQTRERHIACVPYIFTFGNAIFGFISILNALDGHTIIAAVCIMCAAIMDFFDGRIARALGTTSYLGQELDSLCDAISFCLAPMILLHTALYDRMSPIITASLAVYLCAGLYRLALFNLTALKQKDYFRGLPTPFAALFIAQLILYIPWISTHACKILLYKTILPFVVVSFALLMVSAIPFPTGKNITITSSKQILCLIAFAMITLFIITTGYPIFLLLMGAYIATGISQGLLYLFLR